ncbi:MAG: Fic family protein [bacterium]
MNDLLKIIHQKKNELDLLRPLPLEFIKNLDDWFKVESTYNSNAIEGNTLSKQETTLIIEKGITIGGKSLKEHLEATNLAFAIDYIKKITNKRKQRINLKDILNLHYLILKKIDDKNAGKLRNIAVKIAGSDSILPDPLKLSGLMDDFIKRLHSVDEDIIKIAADAHLKLLLIHPFVDGNGRTARLLMDLLLMQKGFPPAIIKVEDRLVYIKSISKAERTGNNSDYYQIIFNAVDKSLDIYLELAEKSK